MIEQLHDVIYWTGVLTWISLALLLVIAVFTSAPFIAREDIAEPTGDASDYPASRHNVRRVNFKEPTK